MKANERISSGFSCKVPDCVLESRFEHEGMIGNGKLADIRWNTPHHTLQRAKFGTKNSDSYKLFGLSKKKNSQHYQNPRPGNWSLKSTSSNECSLIATLQWGNRALFGWKAPQMSQNEDCLLKEVSKFLPGFSWSWFINHNHHVGMCLLFRIPRIPIERGIIFLSSDITFVVIGDLENGALFSQIRRCFSSPCFISPNVSLRI